MRISIEAEISEERESCTFFKLKTGFGDPIVIIHKDNFEIEYENPPLLEISKRTVSL